MFLKSFTIQLLQLNVHTGNETIVLNIAITVIPGHHICPV